MTKKLAILAGLLVLSVTTAFAYTIDDPTNQVFDWSSHPDNFDRVGNKIFEIFGMNITPGLNTTTFEIFSNFPQAGETVGSWPTFPADLAFNFDGNSSYEYGVAFTGHDALDAGRLYSVTDWFESNDYDPSAADRSWPESGAGYAYHEYQIVTIKTKTDDLALGDLDWNDFDTTPAADSDNLIPNYRISLIFNNSDLPTNFFLRPFDVFYGGANCANDFIGGRYIPPPTIPEPTSMGLLALGCLGLATLRKRRAA